MTVQQQSASANTWPFFPKTLVGQIVLPIVVVLLLALTAVAWASVNVLEDHLVRAQTEELMGEARVAAFLAQPLLMRASPDAMLETEGQALVTQIAAATDGHVTLMLPNGNVIGDSLQPGGRQAAGAETEAALDDGIGSSRRVNPFSNEPFRYVAVAVTDPATGEVIGVVRVGQPTTAVDERLTRWRWGALVSVLGLTTIGGGLALTLARRLDRSLAAVQQHAHAVARGELEPEVIPPSVRELEIVATMVNGFAAASHDVGRQLEQERIRLNAVLGSLSDGIILTDAENDVLQMNAAAARMLQIGAEEATGKPFVFVVRDHEIAGALREALANDAVVQLANIEVGLSRRLLDVIARPVSGTSERLGLVALRDVTELRRLETVRREFVANVSHELRTPLASIRALVETLETGAVEDPEMEADFYNRIVMEVDRLASLVNELLDLARLESGRVDLKLVVAETTDLIRHGVERLAPQVERAQLELALDLPPELPPVTVDRARIEQVLLNLVHNAIKFTPPGGRITVRARTQGQVVQVDVCDTGIGIAQDDLDRLFERFYKADKARRSEGTGLGLAISKHIIQAHGGQIWAANQPTGGAIFSFTLPIANERVRRTPDEAQVSTAG